MSDEFETDLSFDGVEVRRCRPITKDELDKAIRVLESVAPGEDCIPVLRVHPDSILGRHIHRMKHNGGDQS